jgi:branched-chain amino acid transport system substrate-binding protein
VTSGMVDALLPTLTASGTVLLTPSASAVKFHGQDDLLFRINLTTRDNGRNYARHVHQRGIHRVAAAMNVNNLAFSESWLTEFENAYTALGGKVVAVEAFDSQSSNHTELVRRLLARQPQGLLVIGNAVDTARLAQQTRKVDTHIPLIAAEWAGSDQLITLGGSAVEGLLIMQNFDQEDSSPTYLRFANLYRQRFGVDPVYGSVLAYDAATAALTALTKRAPGVSTKQALLTLGPYAGLQQQVVFDANGDTQRGAYLMVVRNGRFNRVP